MGSLGGIGGVGIPGPPGPPGPIGTVDGTSPLSVQAKATALPGTVIPPSQWTTLNFTVRETDTHLAITPGPPWRWMAPMRGVYHLLATVRLDGFPGPTPWQLRVLNNGLTVAEAGFSGLSGQIAWLGTLNQGNDLQVQMWGSSTTLVLSGQLPVLPASVSIAGVGVAL